jgi:threonine synthase
VQAAGAAPFHAGFIAGFDERHSTRAETVASAIRIGNPASWDRGVRAIRLTNGAVTSVPDAEILEGQRTVGAAGIGCEPASAASIAGVRRAIATGIVGRNESVVAVLTGHLLKDPVVEIASSDRNEPVEIDASLAAIERELSAVSASR